MAIQDEFGVPMKAEQESDSAIKWPSCYVNLGVALAFDENGKETFNPLAFRPLPLPDKP